MYPNIRLKNGQHVGKRAQATLEIALSLICVFLLLGGSLAIFLWANNRLIVRQEDYENTRVKAGSESGEVQVDESKYPKLDIFGSFAK